MHSLTSSHAGYKPYPAETPDTGYKPGLVETPDTGYKQGLVETPDTGYKPDLAEKPDPGYRPAENPDAGYKPDLTTIQDTGYTQDTVVSQDTGYTPNKRESNAGKIQPVFTQTWNFQSFYLLNLMMSIFDISPGYKDIRGNVNTKPMTFCVQIFINGSFPVKNSAF